MNEEAFLTNCWHKLNFSIFSV